MWKRMLICLLACCLLLSAGLLFGCGRLQSPPQPADGGVDLAVSQPEQPETVPKTPLMPEECAARELAGLTLEEKVGQMFFLAYRKDANFQDLLALDEDALMQISLIQPGGVVLFGENIDTVGQVRALIRTTQEAIRLPPFVSVDQEGGAVQRVRKTTKIPATDIPPMFEVGQFDDPLLSKDVGRAISAELSVFGFNMDFAPECDVFSNPNNTVIGRRAFSSDPQVVARMSAALSEGLRANNIIPVCKHFPGHGDTDGDTHEGLVILDKDMHQLSKTELVPFRRQIEAGAEAVMVAHISLPQINGDNTPATLSKKIINGLLRKQLGFDGIVITDSMMMQAITDSYTTAEATRLAVEAGVDMILMPRQPEEAYRSLLAAVKDGVVSEERIDESVLRILKLKHRYQLFDPAPLADESVLGCEEHRSVIGKIYE